MKEHVTVIPSDRTVIVDSIPLRFDFDAPENLHALQWHDGQGEMEFTGNINKQFGEQEYSENVGPFVALWEAEKARLDKEANHPPALEDVRAIIFNRRRQAEYGGFPFDGQRWDSEEKDELRLNSMITMMDKTGMAEFPGWKINADTVITLTPELAVRAAAGLMSHYAACFQVETAKIALLAAYIESLGDKATASDIQSWLDANLDAGWPGEEGQSGI